MYFPPQKDQNQYQYLFLQQRKQHDFDENKPTLRTRGTESKKCPGALAKYEKWTTTCGRAQGITARHSKNKPHHRTFNFCVNA